MTGFICSFLAFFIGGTVVRCLLDNEIRGMLADDMRIAIDRLNNALGGKR